MSYCYHCGRIIKISYGIGLMSYCSLSCELICNDKCKPFSGYKHTHPSKFHAIIDEDKK